MLPGVYKFGEVLITHPSTQGLERSIGSPKVIELPLSVWRRSMAGALQPRSNFIDGRRSGFLAELFDDLGDVQGEQPDRVAGCQGNGFEMPLRVLGANIHMVLSNDLTKLSSQSRHIGIA